MPNESVIRRIVVKGTLFGTVQTRNIFTVRITTQMGADLMPLAQGYLDPIYAHINMLLTSDFTTHTTQLETKDSQGWLGGDEAPYVRPGLNTPQALANAVAIVLIGKVAGHRGMGRKFFSGISEDAAAANLLESSALTNAGLALAAYVSTYTAEGGDTVEPGLWMKDNAFHPFTSGVLSSLLGSMRRRKPGLGI